MGFHSETKSHCPSLLPLQIRHCLQCLSLLIQWYSYVDCMYRMVCLRAFAFHFGILFVFSYDFHAQWISFIDWKVIISLVYLQYWLSVAISQTKNKRHHDNAYILRLTHQKCAHIMKNWASSCTHFGINMYSV